MKDAIVIGRNYATALGVIRSLGEAGYSAKLLSVNKGTNSIAGKSRYVTQSAIAEDTFDSLFSKMEKLRNGAESILVIPANDRICRMLDAHAEQLSRHYLIPTVQNGKHTLSGFMDKMVQKELALQCGMKAAKGKIWNTNVPMDSEALKDIPFPCFVKPAASANVVGCKTLFAVCHNGDELNKAISYAASRDCEQILAEQFLNIDEELCVYGVAGKGKVYAPACVETFKGGYADHKGVTMEGKVIPASRLGVMQEQIEEMVKRIGLTGLFCVDILKCGEELYFSEMNLRSGGSGYAVTLAGVNLPGALADMVYGQPVTRPMEVQKEIAFLNERIEFDAFIGRHISEQEYKAHMAGNQERFIRSKTDIKPWRAFQIMAFLRITKRKIKKLLRK